MMIVDLIDEVDFKEKLVGIGAPISAQEPLDDAKNKVLTWLGDHPDQKASLVTAMDELENTGATILPEVLTVMKALRDA
ncbi:hypothetical protein ACFQ45_14870 [Rhodanobacter aciditrophus]|uniref:Uncharacterized protein n=1 Tax=Rhodanobacter aciditrophus TaxID=1623218 RepID=A0ABW4B400_9GAMM